MRKFRGEMIFTRAVPCVLQKRIPGDQGIPALELAGVKIVYKIKPAVLPIRVQGMVVRFAEGRIAGEAQDSGKGVRVPPAVSKLSAGLNRYEKTLNPSAQ